MFVVKHKLCSKSKVLQTSEPEGFTPKNFEFSGATRAYSIILCTRPRHDVDVTRSISYGWVSMVDDSMDDVFTVI